MSHARFSGALILPAMICRFRSKPLLRCTPARRASYRYDSARACTHKMRDVRFSHRRFLGQGPSHWPPLDLLILSALISPLEFIFTVCLLPAGANVPLGAHSPA